MHPNWLGLDQAGEEFLHLLWKWVRNKFSPYKNVIYQFQITFQGIRYLFLFDKEGNLDANSSQTKYCQHTQRSWLSNNIKQRPPQRKENIVTCFVQLKSKQCICFAKNPCFGKKPCSTNCRVDLIINTHSLRITNCNNNAMHELFRTIQLKTNL